MAVTARFGLTLGDALSDHDKQVIDAVLSALELHTHKGGNQCPDPSGPAGVALETTGGHLQGGVTIYYRHSYVDTYGLESAASAEIAVTTPTPVSVPGTPVLTALPGGTLAPGVVYYALSAVDASGNETSLSDPGMITVSTYLTVQVAGRPFGPGVVSYNVWRQGARSTGFTKIGNMPDPAHPFVDTGAVPDDPCACDPANLPPAYNYTNATSQVTLMPADVALVGASPSSVRAWRIYRTVTSGAYPANSLLAEINTFVNPDGTGGLVTSFVDDGTTGLTAGQPLEFSQTLHPSVKIMAGGTSAVLFDAGSSAYWRLVTSADGALVARASPGGKPDPALGATWLLSEPGNVPWEVTLDSNGDLITLGGAPGPNDTAYLAGQGPLLPSPDPTISYRLGVTDDGALTTVEV